MVAPQHHRWYVTTISSIPQSSVREGFFTIVDQGFISVTNFLTGIIIARFVPKEDFGLYVLGLSIVFFVMNIQSSLVSSPYTVYSPRLDEKDGALYSGSTLVHVMVLSTLAAAFFFVLGGICSFSVERQGMVPIAWALSVVISFMLIREYGRRTCFAKFKITYALWLDLSVAVVQLGGLVIIAYSGSLSVSHSYLVIGIACTLPTIYWLIDQRDSFVFRSDRIVYDFFLNWSLGKWIFAELMVFLLNAQLYPWLLAAFHGAGATGMLGVCLSVAAFANPLFLGLGNYLGPKAAHACMLGGDTLHKLIIRVAILTFILMTFFCFAIFLFGEYMVTSLYGAKYTGSGVVVSILALGVLISVLASVFGYGLWAMERPDLNFMTNLIGFGVTISLGLWLTKTYGLKGASVGLLVSNTGLLLARYSWFNRMVRSSQIREK